MAKSILKLLTTEATHLEQAGLLRREPVLQTPQGPTLEIGGKELLNLASNDYLGLTNHTELKKAAKSAIDSHGVGLGSPRMVGGNLPVHAELEAALTKWLGAEDTLLFPSGYHAGTGLLESFLGERDYVFCDEQTHPSLADGVRLSRARVLSFRSDDMDHLEDRLKRSHAARFRVIATNGVFPLSGTTANLAAICALGEKYDALVVIDDRHGIGVHGTLGRGTADKLGVLGKVDAVTGTFGVTLGGGAGGFVSGRKAIIGWLRQKSRPHLVSTSLPPASAAAALKAVELLSSDESFRESLSKNVKLFRGDLSAAGLDVIDSDHPIVCVLSADAVTTQRATDLLFKKGIFAMGFCHPSVPEGAARIRAQVTAKHSQKALKGAAATFAEAVREAKDHQAAARVSSKK